MNFRFPSDSPASVARRAAAIERERKVVVKTTRGSVFEEYLRNIGHPAAKVKFKTGFEVDPGHDDTTVILIRISEDGGATFKAGTGDYAYMSAQPDALKPGEWMDGKPAVDGLYARLWCEDGRTVYSWFTNSVWSLSWDSLGIACGYIGSKGISPEQNLKWRPLTPDEQAPANSFGWIEWTGGECPVAKGTLVQLRFQSGVEHKEAIPALQSFLARAKDWAHENYFGMSQYNIIAYRVVAK